MVRVARRAKTRKQRRVNRKDRRQGQHSIQRQIDEAIADLVRQIIERVLQGQVTELLGRAKSQRRDLDDMTIVEASCNRCGTRYRRSFYRGGYYERGLLTFQFWGKIKVPRLSCVCGGMVDIEFLPLVPYGRLWFDLEERARQLAALCISLRDSVEVLAWQNGQPLSIATLNRLVNEAAVLAEAFHAGPLERVPAVVMLDGIWLKVLEPTGEEYVDKKGRRRQRMKGRKFPLLVAYGVDPVSGERWLLDWELGREEDEQSWRKLLERLLERGLCAKKGLRLFVHDGSAGLEKAFEMVYFGVGVERQRCIFHKLRNVRRDVVGEEGMSRKARQERRGAVLADAAAVYQGEDEAEIRQRLAGFREKWVAREPKAVASLEREFDRTLVYLKVKERARRKGEDWKVECLRATSALERVQRHFRQKARQVVVFHCERGVLAGIQLVISHRRLAGAVAMPWQRLLEEAILAA
ncbi:MAG: transposase [Chloroflexota bacterium]